MLNVVSLEIAKEIISEKLSSYTLDSETVSLKNSLGRVLYSDVVSSENIPSFDRSTVDGFAVRAVDTYGSGESIPSQLNIVGEILMGEKADMEIGEGECVRISTGGMLPKNADSVVMVENTDCTFDEFCLIFKAVSPFENVTRKGDDLKEGQIILKKGTIVSSKHIGVLASLGITHIDVVRKIRVGIISTGDELVPIDSPSEMGKIRDINTHILSALVSELGCIGTEYGIVDDNFEAILEATEKAADENDIVLISGGSSAGVRDMTVKVIADLGEVYFHGIALKPGKPTICGKVKDKAIFGLPGHPAAAYYVTLMTVKPLIESLYEAEINDSVLTCPVSQNISSNHGREEIVSVKIIDGKAVPAFSKSGVVSALSDSDGYIIIDRNSEGLKKDDTVKVHLF